MKILHSVKQKIIVMAFNFGEHKEFDERCYTLAIEDLNNTEPRQSEDKRD